MITTICKGLAEDSIFKDLTITNYIASGSHILSVTAQGGKIPCGFSTKSSTCGILVFRKLRSLNWSVLRLDLPRQRLDNAA